MTKKEFIGEVLLMVSGGRPTSDMSVRETDVRSYMGPAINWAMDKGDNMNREDERDRDYLSEFYSEHENVPIDWSGNKPKFVLEKGTVPLKGNGGLRHVYDNCDNEYGKLTDSDMGSVKYYTKLTPCMGWYRRVGNNVYLYGVGPMAETMNYQALTSVNDLDDDDELPLTAGTEVDALRICFEMATGQMSNPYDSRIDHDDINKAR